MSSKSVPKLGRRAHITFRKRGKRRSSIVKSSDSIKKALAAIGTVTNGCGTSSEKSVASKSWINSGWIRYTPSIHAEIYARKGDAFSRSAKCSLKKQKIPDATRNVVG